MHEAGEPGGNGGGESDRVIVVAIALLTALAIIVVVGLAFLQPADKATAALVFAFVLAAVTLLIHVRDKRR